MFIAAAESHRIARHAAGLGRIEVDERAPVLTIDEAIAVRSHLENPVVYRKGDPGAAIAVAPHSLSGRVETGGQEHFYLEGQAAMAVPREDGGMLVYCSSQHPSEIQQKVAEVLGVDLGRVRVEVRRMGRRLRREGKPVQCPGNGLCCGCVCNGPTVPNAVRPR